MSSYTTNKKFLSDQFVQNPLDIQNGLYGDIQQVVTTGSSAAYNVENAIVNEPVESLPVSDVLNQAETTAPAEEEPGTDRSIRSVQSAQIPEAEAETDAQAETVQIASISTDQTLTFTNYFSTEIQPAPQPAVLEQSGAQIVEVAVTSDSPAPGGTLSEVTAGVGNDNPTVSFGLTGISDWSTQSAFIDIVKTMRPWIGHTSSEWGAMKNFELEDGGYLDENGWPTEIPDGIDSIGTIWVWEQSDIESRKGVYVATYEGEGTIQLKNVKILSQEDGRIVFENTDGGTMALNIKSTDPDGTGDYIRNLSVVHEDYVALHEAGAIFNPEWLDKVADAREFRFMDWMKTNSSNLSSWEDRSNLDDVTWRSAPIEVMVRLANEAGVDPWFNIPHLADDEFIRNFAEYVRDNLDPNLTARVEWSNEVWNTTFAQHRYAREQAIELWGGEGEYHQTLDYQGMRATQTAMIWEDVFAESDNAPTLVNVLGSRPGSHWLSERVLTSPSWRANDPDGYVEPASVFDELAVTTYFGSSTVTSSALRTELLEMIADPSVDATAWLAQKLMDPTYSQSIPKIAEQLEASRAAADDYGVGLVAYEGGQHVHHSAFIGLSKEEESILTEFMTDFVRSPEMADLYHELWKVWAAVSDGAFMQFGDVGVASKHGSWSILSDLNDTNPRAEFLFDQMQNATPWWDAEANVAYLQGITSTGTDLNDQMFGTDQEDFLAGGRGNDRFTVGAGRDGINGGIGIDSLVLSGSAADYTIAPSGKGYVLNGPDGEKFVINLENFEFGDGSILTLDEMLVLSGNEPSGEIPGSGDDQGNANPNDDTTFALNLSGEIRDAGNANEVAISPVSGGDSGVFIQSIARASDLGKELGLNSNDHDRGYAVFGSENRSAFEFAFETPNASPDQQGIPGGQASLSAVDTALELGDIVLDPTKITATSGRDWFLGHNRNEIVDGGAGNDYLDGGQGNDSLFGGADRDTIFGGKGKDLVVGGLGNDVLSGGEGADRYYFTAGDGDDRILDFDTSDVLEFQDYLNVGQTLADVASQNDYGNLVISNGSDQITFEGLNLDDLDWITVA